VAAVGNYIDVIVEDESVIVWPVEIRIYYTQADLDAAKVAEDQIVGMYYWNGSAWILYNDTGVNTANVGVYEGYVWGLVWNEDMLSPKVAAGIDNTPPISDSYITFDPDGYVCRASTFHIYATDDGVAWKIYYKIDDVLLEGKWNKEVYFQFNEHFGIYESGEHTIEYWAVDAWNNEEKPHHVETYYLDVEPPSVNISFVGICEITMDARYQITPLTLIQFNAEDEGCGLDRIEYRIDDGEWLPYEQPFALPSGIYNIYVAAYDRLGNIGGKHYVIQVGGGEPTTTIHVLPDEPNGNNGWYTTSVKITLEAYDEASGVTSTFYRIDGKEWIKYDEPFEVGEGVHKIEYYSIDNAGLAEKIKVREIKVDLYAPEINIEKPKNWLYIANRAILPLFGDKPVIIGKITIVANIADKATSGVETTMLYIDEELKAEGSDHISYTLDETIFGEHVIKIVASDVAGNVAREEIKALIYNVNTSI
jgi:hypothetical protein